MSTCSDFSKGAVKPPMGVEMKIWACKIGEVDAAKLPKGADEPMRQAVIRAYREITGTEPTLLFSGWGGELTDAERRVVEEKPGDVRVIGGSLGRGEKS